MSLSNHLDLLATAPDGIKCLRGLILELAVRGKLVPQNPDDEPASELLKRIEVEKARLVKEGKIRKPKALEAVGEDEQRPPFPGGDATARNRISPPYPGFNPRPPFPGGDAPSPATTESRGTKSPHCANLKIPGQKISYENHYHPETPCRSEVIATRESPWKCLITWGSRNFTESTEHQNQLHENSHVLGPRNP